MIDEENHLGTLQLFEVLVIIDKSQVRFLVIWGLILLGLFFLRTCFLNSLKS